MSVEIREIPLGGHLRPFLDVVDNIYRDDPSYVRPLDMLLKDQLSRKNPFFAHAEGAIFVAFTGRRCVGRITAQVDHAHLDRHRDDAGFFGFLDTVHDPAVCSALLDRATDWARQRGMKRLRGPYSLSINEEIGCLIEGFDTPPMFMNPHHRFYQGALIEQAGFAKLKDLFCWRYVVGQVPERAAKAHAEVSRMPEITSRTVNLKDVDREVQLIMDIFNDGWVDNWGAVPLTQKELHKLAQDLRLMLVPELTRVVFLDGEAVAFGIALPNLNEVIKDLHGKLFPTGFAKLLWRLKVVGPQTARLILLGIRKRLRHLRKYAGLSTYMYVEMNRAGERTGIKWGELSWTLEDNAPVNVGIKFMGGKVYKKMRIYEREIA
jgi:hypothetical protein